MIVQCPSCSSRYRVNDSNIPATGGRINCPSCAHSFIVYPEAKAAPAPSAYDGEKTSVATNFNDLMRGAGFGGGAPAQAPADDDGDLATEVISGDSLPNFAGGMFGGGGARPPASPPEEDGTVEMENPLKFLSQGGSLPGIGGGGSLGGGALGGDASEAYDPTQVVSADMASALGGFGGPAASPFGAPPNQGGDDALRTEIVSAEDAVASFGFGGGAPASEENEMTEVVDPHSVFNSPVGPPAQANNPFGGPPSMPSFANQPGAQPQPTPLFGGAPPATPPSFGGASGLQGLQSPMGDPGQPGLGGVPGASVDSLPPVGADPNHQGPWKLKTNFGLTYEFQDTGSLLNWMSSKDDFTGYTLSVGDENFHPLSDFPQISTGVSGKPSNPEAIAPPMEQPAAGVPGGMGMNDPFAGAPAPVNHGGFGSGGFDGVGGMPQHQHQQPRSAGPAPHAPGTSPLPAHPTSGGGSSPILWVVFGVLIIAVLLLGLQITGVVDFKAMLGLGAPAPVEQPAPIAQPGAEEPADDSAEPGGEVAAPDGDGEELEMSAEDRKHFNDLIEMARTSMSEKKYQSAKETLEKAKMIGPGELPVYTLLAEVHEKLGEEDLALEAKKKAEDIRMNMNME